MAGSEDTRRLIRALLLCVLWQTILAENSANNSTEESWEITAVMPEHPAPPESYLCFKVDLPDSHAAPLKIVGIEPLSKEELVHHMLLFGCEQRQSNEGVWSCQGHGVCPGGGNQQILYGWAKGAPAMKLPQGVGFMVGKGTKIDNLVLQIHYAVERPKEDVSGIKVFLTSAHVPFSAGMLMYASFFEIPPQREHHLIPNRCCYSGFEPTHGFAFRVHTHMLGRSVYLDNIVEADNHQRIVEHSPQLPQGFTPVSGVTFWPGQRLEATCDFNSMERTEPTFAGATHHNEMCNLYMIMWSELPVFMSCYDSHASFDRHGPGGIPSAAVLLEESLQHWKPPQSIVDISKPPSGHYIGQISGLAKGHNGSVWVFHRGDRVWNGASFTGQRGEHVTYKEPIKAASVLQLDQDTGEVLGSWGGETFYMPHMATVDQLGNIWLTDVGLHQVFKYNAQGKLLLTLGKKLEPGVGDSFCKPTQVAVANDGTVYVSDGYCNARVAQFSPQGSHLGDFALEEGAMSVPHSLVLDECSNALIVADRESAKVHRFDTSTKKLTGTWDLSKEGLVFGLATGPYGALFALCWDRDKHMDGSSTVALLHSDPGQGVEERWKLEGVESPHDIAIVAAPLRLATVDRPLAVLVAETRLSHSRIHKFVLMPSGTTILEGVETSGIGSATQQWAAVHAASALRLAQLPDEAAAGAEHSETVGSHSTHLQAHRSNPNSPSVGNQGMQATPHSKQVSKPTILPDASTHQSARQVALVALPVLFCCVAAFWVRRRYKPSNGRHQHL